jgi:hypothetical protein
MTNPLTAYINSLLDAAEARMDRAGIPKGGDRHDGVLHMRQDYRSVSDTPADAVTGAAHPNNAAIECVEVVCFVCNGWGHVHDGYRGSERDVPCSYCAGKGTIVTEKQQ